ncbi:MAG TPA: sulfatase [Verrucomicrobiales bacterium]|nr:sulfatase [Verrucomicrobiales bacterium]
MAGRRRIGAGLALLVSLAGMASGGAGPDREESRPNILFLLADDLGWADLGCSGSTFYETPGLDGLAAESMRFTAAYAACQVCSPTRASIHTGKYPQRLGITDFIHPGGGNQPGRWTRPTALLPAAYRDRLPHEETTLAEALRESGYATFFAGKWHLGPEGFYPEDHGFDINRGGIEAGGPYGGDKYFSPYGNPRLADGPDGEHLPDRLAEETLEFMEQNRQRPFFACLSFYSVHTPLMAREDLEAKYKQKAGSVRPSSRVWGVERERQVRQAQDHAVYGGMVEAMDQAVEKLLRGLEELDLDERTLVIFFSDNGGLSTSEGSPTSNLPLRAGKGWVYEGGIRVPLIVRWPGVTPKGVVAGSPVMSTDFYPTILEAAGLPLRPAQHVDGVSFVSLLRGQDFDRGPMFWHYPHYGNQGGAPCGAVRDGNWKLIEWYEDGAFELYRVDVDISERVNLAGREAQRTERLAAMLRDWRGTVGASMPSVRE